MSYSIIKQEPPSSAVRTNVANIEDTELKVCCKVELDVNYCEGSVSVTRNCYTGNDINILECHNEEYDNKRDCDELTGERHDYADRTVTNCELDVETCSTRETLDCCDSSTCYKTDLTHPPHTVHQPNEGSNSSSELQIIETFSLKKKLNQCSFCNFKASRKYDLKEHERRHTGDKPHQCGSCDFRAVAKRELDAHKAFHKGDKPHQCSFCDFKTVSKRVLKRHEKIHGRLTTPIFLLRLQDCQ